MIHGLTVTEAGSYAEGKVAAEARFTQIGTEGIALHILMTTTTVVTLVA